MSSRQFNFMDAWTLQETTFGADFQLDSFGRTVAHVANTKVKRNKFFWALFAT